MVGDRAEALGVTAAVARPRSLALLVLLAVGATGYAGSRLRSLRLTGQD